MKQTVAALVLLTATLSTFAWAPPVSAQEAESPPRYVWVATQCADWGCALEAMALAQGDRTVMILPTRSAAWPWVVVKRMLAGSIDLSDDSVFHAECFSHVGEASARYETIDGTRSPLLVSTVDGGMLVVCLRDPEGRRRSVAP